MQCHVTDFDHNVTYKFLIIVFMFLFYTDNIATTLKISSDKCDAAAGE